MYHRAASNELASKFPESFSISKSASIFTTDPEQAQEAASSLLQAARALLARAGEAAVTTAVIRDSLTSARTQAEAVAASAEEIQGVADTAALVDDGLQSVTEAAASPEADDLVALEARRRQSYTLKIRTQEGDLVKISLRTSQNLSQFESGSAARSESADAEPGNDIALQASARLKLRVLGDINDAELAAIASVFEQAADIARNFFDGDLAEALATTGALEFDTSQIAKIRLHFRSQTAVSALYAPAQTETPALPTAEDFAESGVDNSAGTESAAASVDDSGNGAIDTLSALVEAITAYFSSVIEGLDDLQSNGESGHDSRYRLVTAFKLDVLKATLIASADDQQADIATHTAEAIDEAATAEAA